MSSVSVGVSLCMPSTAKLQTLAAAAVAADAQFARV